MEFINSTTNQSHRSKDRGEFLDRTENQSHSQHQQQQHPLPQRTERAITGRHHQQPQTQSQQLQQSSQQQQHSSQTVRHPNTLLTTNHTLPISSSVISNSVNPQQQPQSQPQQHYHNPQQPSQQQIAQSIAHIQQQQGNEIMQTAGHDANRTKRYSSLRHRTVIDYPQQIPVNEMGIPLQIQDTNILLQMQQQQQQQQQAQQHQTDDALQTAQQNYSHQKSTAANYPVGIDYSQQIAPPAGPPQPQHPTQYAQPYLPNAGPPSGYLQQPPPPAASVAVVQQHQIMNLVPTHTPLQPLPVVPPPVANAQVVPQATPNQFPTYPTYPGVQNYNAAVSESFHHLLPNIVLPKYIV